MIDRILTYLIANLQCMYVSFASVTAAKILKDSYVIKKLHKLSNVTTAQLPIEVKRKDNDLEVEKTIESEFIDNVKTFEEVLIKNIPEEQLTLAFNNLSTLSMRSGTFKDKNQAGGYLSESNHIIISNSAVNQPYTVYHELFHMASCNTEENAKEVKRHVGFAQIIDDCQFGTAINEGYTDYLVEKYFGNKFEIPNSTSLILAKNLEKIVGSAKMQELYFTANLKGLIDVLEQYAQVDEIYKFINASDFLYTLIHYNPNVYYFTKPTSAIFEENYKCERLFLYKLFVKKKINNCDKENLNIDNLLNEVKQEIIGFANTENYIYTRRFSKISKIAFRKRFTFDDEKLLMQAIKDVLYESFSDKNSFSK